MDSLSQIVLGAAVCGAITRQPLRRALAYGAVLGTLPDLDVLVLGHLDPVEQFVRHRSFSHSLFVLSAVSPPIAWLLRRLDRWLLPIAAWRWFLAVWLVLITHPLLDACTVYGTQLWWPLMPPPTSGAFVFIIDPLYTLPLLIAVLATWWRGNANRAAPILLTALLVSHAYLAWGWLARQHVEREVAAELARRGQPVEALMASPAPFTTLLWRVLVRTPQGHSEAWYSLLREDPAQLSLRVIASDVELRTGLPPIPALQTLQWFSHGYLKVESIDGRLRAADLRMGADPDYFFAFDLALRADGEWQPIVPQRAPMERPRAQRLREVWHQL